MALHGSPHGTGAATSGNHHTDTEDNPSAGAQPKGREHLSASYLLNRWLSYGICSKTQPPAMHRKARRLHFFALLLLVFVFI
jgi:hypothetical protein